MRVFFTILAISATLQSAELTRGPYLQQAHAGGVTVVWRVKGKFTVIAQPPLTGSELQRRC